MVIKNIADLERVVREIDAERDAKATTPPKRCFVISPIGETGSEVRKRADQVLKYVIRPAVEAFGYAAVRADEIAEPGLITTQIIDRVINDDLVIADLTGRNPNVYYELAIRHAIRKPFVQLISAGEALPFDIVGMRTVSVDHHDLDSVAGAIEELKAQLGAIEANPDATQTPISTTVDLADMRRSARPEDRVLADVLGTLAELTTRVADIQMTVERGPGPSVRVRPPIRVKPTGAIIRIVREEGNRRDAELHCRYCDGDFPLHFYEGDGEPKLNEVLGLMHYWQCPGVKGGQSITIYINAPNREISRLEWVVPLRRGRETVGGAPAEAPDAGVE
jgi:hypothetical protein